MRCQVTTDKQKTYADKLQVINKLVTLITKANTLNLKIINVINKRFRKQRYGHQFSGMGKYFYQDSPQLQIK